ncbi:MAG: 2-amino-3,7-dideoxy-D-threo-hept-6-ulosonate synthase [Candidatus Thermoplasmatota archaeon]|nr:2-amino-3,7-dideoxy-D-threo-hept-6-ulosonate synthase [Candidatus Thermoplasmatota archaeon]
MSSPGIGIRLRRIAPSGRAVIIPMDHGVSSGPVQGLERPAEAVYKASRGGATAVVVHKGLVPVVATSLGEAGLIVHLSASTSLNPDTNDKRLVGSVAEAARLGADAISVHVNVGAPTESRMISDLGAVSRACTEHGMPLLAMMYPRGPGIEDPHDVALVKQVARLGAELGADLIKCPYTGDVATFEQVVETCPVPVVISGGPRMDTPEDVLSMVAGAVEAGAAGVSIGRNAFQAEAPTAMVRAMRSLILDGQSLEKVLEAGPLESA